MHHHILSALRAHARQSGDQVAFIGEHGKTALPFVLTYRQLFEQVEQYAVQLQNLSARCIAIYAENSLNWLIADLAAMSARIPCVPIPKFFSTSQIDHVLKQTQADILIYDACPQSVCQRITHGLEEVGTLGELSIARRAIDRYENAPDILPETVKITFTSGSTGEPKGVCLSQTNLDQVTCSLAHRIGQEDQLKKHLVMLPLSTLLENITGVYVPLFLGVTSVVLNGASVGLTGSSQFDASRMIEALVTHRPNTLVLTPALLHALIAIAIKNPDVVSSLDFIAVGGAQVPASVLYQAHRSGIPAFEGYGLSECGSVVSMNSPEHHRPGTAGQILPHARVRIAEDGEVWVKHAAALGYLGQPFTDSWVATGDLGSLDEQGFLSILGRKKNQIITSFGRNISPEWVEAVAQQWPELRSLVVTGEGQERLSALVFTQPSTAVLSGMYALNAQLPDYARICRLIFVKDPRIGQSLWTANGRPRRDLIEQQMSEWNRLRSESAEILIQSIE
jgi:long-subunit acyl-CoA synthetase (AMP-forming)